MAANGDNVCGGVCGSDGERASEGVCGGDGERASEGVNYLCELPNELIVGITDFCDPQSRRSLAQTCRRLRDVVEPTVFPKVRLMHGILTGRGRWCCPELELVLFAQLIDAEQFESIDFDFEIPIHHFSLSKSYHEHGMANPCDDEAIRALLLGALFSCRKNCCTSCFGKDLHWVPCESCAKGATCPKCQEYENGHKDTGLCTRFYAWSEIRDLTENKVSFFDKYNFYDEDFTQLRYYAVNELNECRIGLQLLCGHGVDKGTVPEGYGEGKLDVFANLAIASGNTELIATIERDLPDDAWMFAIISGNLQLVERLVDSNNFGDDEFWVLLSLIEGDYAYAAVHTYMDQLE